MSTCSKLFTPFVFLAVMLNACSQDEIREVNGNSAKSSENADSVEARPSIFGPQSTTTSIEDQSETDAQDTSPLGLPSTPADQDNVMDESIDPNILFFTNASLEVGESNYARSEQVTLHLNGDGATYMYVTNTEGCMSGGSWELTNEKKAWILMQKNAPTKVFVKFGNGNGQESACIEDTVIHDDIAPESKFISIDGDAPFTASSTVNVGLAAVGALEMYLSNDATCNSGGTWEPYASSKQWVLGQENAETSVFVKYRDTAGNESACVSDSIIHDNTPPTTPSILINENAIETTGMQVVLSLSALDEPHEVYITNTPDCLDGGMWEPYIESKKWLITQINTELNVYVKFRDIVGNESNCVSDAINHFSLDCNSLPGDWILVPGDYDYDTNDFCIMKFEAKNINGMATSDWQGAPWVDISQIDAKTQCTNLGERYRLISNEQWMLVSSNAVSQAANWSNNILGQGTIIKGHSDISPNAACDASQNDQDAHLGLDCLSINTGAADQRRTHTIIDGSGNAAIIWDLSGNVREWVDYTTQNKPKSDQVFNEIYLIDDSESDLKIPMLIPISKSFWLPNWGISQGVGSYISGNENVEGALYRGSAWFTEANAGLFEAGLELGAGDRDIYTGFRCVYGLLN